MIKDLSKIVIVGVVVFSLAGCSTRMGNFTVISTKNIDLGKKYVRATATNKKAIGIDCKQIVVVIPMGQPNIQDAVDKALESYDANVLTDAVIYYDYFYIPYVYGEIKYRVEGDAWKVATRNDDLSDTLEKDLKNAQEVYAFKVIDGKSEFVQITKNDKVLDQVH